jgi:hypothetical protein
MTAKKTAEELRRDSEFCARQALDLRQTADGLSKRAAALERLSEALLRRSDRLGPKTKTKR